MEESGLTKIYKIVKEIFKEVAEGTFWTYTRKEQYSSKEPDNLKGNLKDDNTFLYFLNQIEKSSPNDWERKQKIESTPKRNSFFEKRIQTVYSNFIGGYLVTLEQTIHNSIKGNNISKIVNDQLIVWGDVLKEIKGSATGKTISKTYGFLEAKREKLRPNKKFY